MAVHIRLARGGTKKRPFYRIVVTDQRNPATGKFLENIGTYDPRKDNGILDVKEERFAYWTGVGAQASPTLERVIKAKKRALEAAAK